MPCLVLDHFCNIYNGCPPSSWTTTSLLESRPVLSSTCWHCHMIAPRSAHIQYTKAKPVLSSLNTFLLKLAFASLLYSILVCGTLSTQLPRLETRVESSTAPLHLPFKTFSSPSLSQPRELNPHFLSSVILWSFPLLSVYFQPPPLQPKWYFKNANLFNHV